MDRRKLFAAPALVLLGGCTTQGQGQPNARATLDKLAAAVQAVNAGLQAIVPQLQTVPGLPPDVLARVVYWANAVSADVQQVVQAIDLNAAKAPAQQLV